MIFDLRGPQNHTFTANFSYTPTLWYFSEKKGKFYKLWPTGIQIKLHTSLGYKACTNGFCIQSASEMIFDSVAISKY
jgi:hypothetical protein